MLVIHTLNWIHIGAQAHHFGFGPFLTAVACYFAQQTVIEDINHHTLPTLFFFVPMAVALVQRAGGRRVDLVWRVPDSLNLFVGNALYLAFDIIWTPYIGLIASMILNRVMDHVYFSPELPRLAWTTTIVLLIPYLFIASTQLNAHNMATERYYEVYRATQNACGLSVLLAIASCIIVAVFTGRQNWLEPKPETKNN